MQITKKLDAINSKDWKRRVVVTGDIEITNASPPALLLAYAEVFQNIKTPRHLMRAGYQDARREWLGVIADALQRGLPIPECDFEEIVLMLKKIADGELPAVVFCLDDDARKKRKINLQALHEIANTVYAFYKQGYPLVEESKKVETAFMMTAKSLGFKTETRLKKEARRARQGWEIFGVSITEFWETGIWEEPFPSIEKLTAKTRKK